MIATETRRTSRLGKMMFSPDNDTHRPFTDFTVHMHHPLCGPVVYPSARWKNPTSQRLGQQGTTAQSRRGGSSSGGGSPSAKDEKFCHHPHQLLCRAITPKVSLISILSTRRMEVRIYPASKTHLNFSSLQSGHGPDLLLRLTTHSNTHLLPSRSAGAALQRCWSYMHRATMNPLSASNTHLGASSPERQYSKAVCAPPARVSVLSVCLYSIRKR